MKKYKRIVYNIGKIVVFFSILIIVLVVASKNVTKKVTSKEANVQIHDRVLTNIDKEENNTIDVLFVGDSLCCRSFSPQTMWDEYGYTSYAVGQTAQLVQETYFGIKKSLENQSPKVIVLETSVLFRQQGYIEVYQHTIEEYEKYYLPVFRLHDQWKDNISSEEKKKDTLCKGYYPTNRTKAYNGKSNYMDKKAHNDKMQPVVKEYMDKIVEMCKENNIELCLVSVPSALCYNNNKNSEVEKMAKKYSLDFLNMNLLNKDELNMNWKTDTYDEGDHLNKKGATKVSKYYGNYLKKKYDLKDRRKDKKYSSWNEL